MYIVVAKVFNDIDGLSFSDCCYGHFERTEDAQATVERILDEYPDILVEDLEIWGASALFTNLTMKKEIIIA